MIRINNYGLFRDFTAQEAAEMKKWATDIVLHGKIAYPDPEWVTSWMQVHNYDERQRLMSLKLQDSLLMVLKIVALFYIHMPQSLPA